MRLGFYMPWWLLPFALLVWLFVILPVKLVAACIVVIAEMFRGARQPRRVEPVTRVRIIIRDHEKTPSQPEG